MGRTVRKYSPGVAAAGLAITIGGALGAQVVESTSAEREANQVSQCTQSFHDELLTEEQANDCITSARFANDAVVLTNYFEFAGAIGATLFGVVLVSQVIDGSVREETTDTSDNPPKPSAD